MIFYHDNALRIAAMRNAAYADQFYIRVVPCTNYDYKLRNYELKFATARIPNIIGVCLKSHIPVFEFSDLSLKYNSDAHASEIKMKKYSAKTHQIMLIIDPSECR